LVFPKCRWPRTTPPSGIPLILPRLEQALPESPPRSNRVRRSSSINPPEAPKPTPPRQVSRCCARLYSKMDPGRAARSSERRARGPTLAFPLRIPSFLMPSALPNRCRRSGRANTASKVVDLPGPPRAPLSALDRLTFVPIANFLSASFLLSAGRLLAPSSRAAGRLRSLLGSYKFHHA